MGIVIASAGVGALLTALTGGQPGTLIGVCLIVGTLLAGILVTPWTVHLVIPVPALAYMAAAILAGISAIGISDMSKTSLAIHVLQWIARGFLTMAIATALAIALTVARRRAWSRSVGMRAR